MKKSQLRKIIKESIKELMTEQLQAVSASVGYPGGGPNGTSFRVAMEDCDPNLGQNSGGCFELNTSNPQIGDHFEVIDTSYMTGIYQWNHPVGNIMKIKYFGGGPGGYVPCPNWAGGTHPGIVHFQPYSGSCPTTSAGSCNPAAWSNHANWTSTFTNTVANHNNPCQFLDNKIAQFTANLQGTGQGNYQNMQNCKLDLANQLHTSNNC